MHATLYADDIMPLGVIGRQTQCCNELRRQCSFGRESLYTRRFERQGEFYVIFLNLMPFYKSGRGKRTLHSLLEPRGDIYESGVTSTLRRTRLHERCRQNYRHGHLLDSSVSHARHQSVNTSRHRIGEASAPAYRIRAY